jgi:hypothetical protein
MCNVHEWQNQLLKFDPATAGSWIRAARQIQAHKKRFDTMGVLQGVAQARTFAFFTVGQPGPELDTSNFFGPACVLLRPLSLVGSKPLAPKFTCNLHIRVWGASPFQGPLSRFPAYQYPR